MNILHFLCGYAIIDLQGLGIERLLRDCTAAGVDFAFIKKLSLTRVRAAAVSGRVADIRRIAEAAGVKVSVRRAGLPGRILRRGNAIAAVCCIAVMTAAVAVVGSRVLRIDVAGLKTVSEASVRLELSRMGIKPGMSKADVNASSAERRLLLSYPELAYVDVGVQGVVLTVRAQEGIAPPFIPDTSRPADIIALTDGCIESVEASSGRAMVTAGATVRRGQTLISGVTGTAEAPRLVCAQGSVYAQVVYRDTTEAPYAGEYALRALRARTYKRVLERIPATAEVLRVRFVQTENRVTCVVICREQIGTVRYIEQTGE